MDIQDIKLFVNFDEILNQLLANLQALRLTCQDGAKHVIDTQGNHLQKLRQENIKNFEIYLKEHI